MLREVTIGVLLAGSPPHRKELFEVIYQKVSFVIDWFQVVKKQSKAFQQLIHRWSTRLALLTPILCPARRGRNRRVADLTLGQLLLLVQLRRMPGAPLGERRV